MKEIIANIWDFKRKGFYAGKIFFEDSIIDILFDDSLPAVHYLAPGLIDAHVHIESSMLTPVEFSRECVKHGVVGIVTDPHEIGNVMGVPGLQFMIDNAKKTPLKIYTGIPSCVPATTFETSGAVIDSLTIEKLFKTGQFSHLSEMMNFPGIINNEDQSISKVKKAQELNFKIDGHAPQLSGENLRNYFNKGISTDHECTTPEEGIEKIHLGMKVLIRKSSASNDFFNLLPLIEEHPDSCMFCTDDSHPDDLKKGYIETMCRDAFNLGYSLDHIFRVASVNAIKHYNLNIGTLQIGDPADFIVINKPEEFYILQTFIDGNEVYNGSKVLIDKVSVEPINSFFINPISIDSIKVPTIKSSHLNIIEVIPNSLITQQLVIKNFSTSDFLESDIDNDILKIIVLNRYSEALPSVGFIKGFGLKQGSIASTVAHDSHNIIAVGTSDELIVKAIKALQLSKGGLVAVDNFSSKILPLPIAGLLSECTCDDVAKQYSDLNSFVKDMGTKLISPFMTLSFMALLVIPELKISDKGLFNINKYSFVHLQE
jgi:adenine deaminase